LKKRDAKGQSTTRFQSPGVTSIDPLPARMNLIPGRPSGDVFLGILYTCGSSLPGKGGKGGGSIRSKSFRRREGEAALSPMVCPARFEDHFPKVRSYQNEVDFPIAQGSTQGMERAPSRGRNAAQF
jgi:hypothetical protein